MKNGFSLTIFILLAQDENLSLYRFLPYLRAFRIRDERTDILTFVSNYMCAKISTLGFFRCQFENEKTGLVNESVCVKEKETA